MTGNTFGTVFNCIDGRVQLPVIKWMKKEFRLEYIDLITEPGIDKVLSQESSKEIESLKTKARVSIEAHKSNIIAIVGHYDCAANPVSKRKHLNQIKKSMQVIQSWNFPVRIIGLWVGETWRVEEFISTGGGSKKLSKGDD